VVPALIRVRGRGEGGRGVSDWVGLKGGSGGGGGIGRDPFVIQSQSIWTPAKGVREVGEGVNFLLHKGFNYGGYTKRGIMDGGGHPSSHLSLVTGHPKGAPKKKTGGNLVAHLQYEYSLYNYNTVKKVNDSFYNYDGIQ
jgi:hypothetical protein